MGRWVRVHRPIAGVIHVAQIAALRGSTAVPIVGTAMTMPPYIPSMGPERVADDNPKTFAHTKADPSVTNAFIEIDLGADTPVDTIVIGNRTDCCADRLLGSIVSLLDAAKRTVWSRPFVTVGSTYHFSMQGPAERGAPSLAFAFDASAPGSLFSDPAGQTPAVPGGAVRHWRGTNGQTLTFSRDTQLIPGAAGSDRPTVSIGGAEGVYARPTLDKDPTTDGGATLVVVCTLSPSTTGSLGGGGHPWKANTASTVAAALLAANGSIQESFCSAAHTAWVPPVAVTKDRLFIYAVVADAVTGVCVSYLDSTQVRVRAAYRWNGTTPARMTPWDAKLSELRMYNGALGITELSAVMSELKTKWNWKPAP